MMMMIYVLFGIQYSIVDPFDRAGENNNKMIIIQ